MIHRVKSSKFVNSPQLRKVIAEPRYCLETLSNIVDKETARVSFTFNASQNRYYSKRSFRDIILKPRQLGFCLSNQTLILTADLNWVQLKDIEIGQEIVAVDENGVGCFKKRWKGKSGIEKSGTWTKDRKMRTAVVEAKNTVYEDAIKLTMDDGRFLICTPNHRWLIKVGKYGNSKYSKKSTDWVETKDIKLEDEIRWITKPWEKGDFDDGWFGGMIDGEGSFRYKNPNGSQRSCGVSTCQVLGEVFDKMEEYAKKRNYTYKRSIYKKKRKKALGSIGFGRMDEIFRLIGQTRPNRFIRKHWWNDKSLPGKKSGIGWAKVVKIEQLLKQEMIDLQTSEKTFIAEGFVSHNSTLVIGLFLHDTMYMSNTLSMLVAQTETDATDMFKKALFMYDSIPDGYKPYRHRENMRALVFPRINSIFTIGSAESRGFGRGKTINNLHCTEVSLPVWDADYLNGLLESVPRNGRVVLESTARGEGGIFYDMYYDAKNGVNEYKNHFYRWWEHREYREPLTEKRAEFIDSYDYEEKELVKKYHLKPEQIKWRRVKKSRLRFLFAQEYPELEDTDAFIKAGSQVFDGVWLRERDDFLPEQSPSQIWLGGDLFIYRMCSPGCKYVVSVDTSEGDVNSDYTAAVVTRIMPLPLEQVALLHGKWTPDIASEKVYKMAKAYNNAQIAVERNNHGHAVLLNLGNGIVRNGVVMYPPYPNLYVGPDKKLGWNTTSLSKNQLVQELDRVMRSGELVVNSKDFIKEARRFVTLKGGGYGVPKSAGNDDIVMAQGIGVMAAQIGKFDFIFI